MDVVSSYEEFTHGYISIFPTHVLRETLISQRKCRACGKLQYLIVVHADILKKKYIYVCIYYIIKYSYLNYKSTVFCKSSGPYVLLCIIAECVHKAEYRYASLNDGDMF
jgi:hypothetical protein